MTTYQTILALGLIFVMIGLHQATTKLLKLLSDHLERFQGKLDVLLVAQQEHNVKVDAILRKLL